MAAGRGHNGGFNPFRDLNGEYTTAGQAGRPGRNRKRGGAAQVNATVRASAAAAQASPAVADRIFGRGGERDALAREHFNGARVNQLMHGNTSEGVMATAKAVFGRDVSWKEISDLTGAPDGAIVRIGTLPSRSGLMMIIDHPLYRSERVDDEIPSFRRIERRGDQVVLVNQALVLSDRAPAGMGTHIFAAQVRAAKAAGVTKIETHASRFDEDEDPDGGEPFEYNGYYTWPRLGYNGSLPAGARKRAVAEGFEDTEDLHGLFEQPGGSAWWKTNGESVDVEFDLSDGSRSTTVLNNYMSRKGYQL